MDLFDQAWSYKFSLLPVFSAYLVFELSTIIRRALLWAYTPIYFLLFPLGHADNLYAQYFNEDDFYGVGESQTPQQKNSLRKRIISISIFSMIFATIVNPAVAGIFSAMFLTEVQFWEFFWFLIILKFAMILISLYRTRNVSFVAVSGSIPWLVAIYAVYFIMILRVVETSYMWALASIQTVGVRGMLINIVDLFIFDFLIYIIIVAAIGAAISYWMTDPDYIPKVDRFNEIDMASRE